MNPKVISIMFQILLMTCWVIMFPALWSEGTDSRRTILVHVPQLLTMIMTISYIAASKPHPPSPFVTITQPESWYSFYRHAECRRLTRPRWLVTYRNGLTTCRRSPITIRYKEYAQEIGVVFVVQWLSVRLVIERSLVRLPAGALPSQLGQLSLPSLRGR